MTLYEIDTRITALIDPETGEIADYEQFEQLQMDREKKLENIGLWIKDLRAEAAAVKEEARSLTDRAKAAENKADRLETYLEYALQGEKFSTPKLSVSWRKSMAAAIEDEAAFCEAHPNYTIVKTEVKPDRKSLLADLKKGVHVEGAVLEERMNIQVK